MFSRSVAVMCLAVGLITWAHATSRSERSLLVWPRPSANIQYLAGFGLPITVGHNSLTMGTFIKSVYNLPTNGSEYNPILFPLQKRDLQLPGRFDVYSFIEKLIKRLSELDGKACLLRSICETARNPIHTKGWWIGDLLHIFLTPSSSEEALQSQDGRDYLAAERMGSGSDLDCAELYSECPMSLPNLVSRLA
ncbi:uncharacterized protein LOC134529173 [Bacillus rossius redtenbacheri]|uniref:uncharacterized protein LOC134529173 n=1 Tax=Bacillus rossius redtenbacheri TaxID=93214 RepID=UPI002FDEB26E